MRGAARYGTVSTLLVFATLVVLLLPQPGETLSEPRREPEPRPRAMSAEPVVTLSPSVKDEGTSGTVTFTASSAFFVDGDTELKLVAQDDPVDLSVSNETYVSTTSYTATVTIASGAADQWVTMKCRAGSSMIIQRAAFRVDGTDTSTNVSFSDAINLAPTGNQVSITLYSPDADFASGDTVTTDNGSITIDTVTYVDTEHLDVDLTVATDSPLGDVKVSVSNGGTKKSLSYLYIVDDTPAEAKLGYNVGKVQEAYRARPVYVVEPSIFVHNGEYITSHTDLVIKGRGFDFVWTRTYRSQIDYNGPMGRDWTTNYNLYVVEDQGGDVTFYDGTGRKDVYTEASGVYTSPAGHYTKMEKVSGVFFITDAHGMEYEFDGPNGKLSKIEDRNGNTMDFYYDFAGYLEEVVDTLGRSIFFYYDTKGRVEFIDDFDLRSVAFAYGVRGELTSVTSPSVDVSINNDYPNGKKTEYTYATSMNPNLDFNLLTIKRPREVASAGSAYLTNTYIMTGNDIDKLDKQTLNGDDVDVTYNTSTKTTVKDRELNEVEYVFVAAAATLTSKTEKTRSLRAGDPSSFVTSYTYNSETEVTQVTLPELNKRQFAWDHTNTNHQKRGNLLTSKKISTVPIQEPDQTTTYTYVTDFNMVDTLTDSRGKVWNRDYDAYGNQTKLTSPTVTSGQPASQSIIEEWTYNSYGQPTQYTDPEGNDTDYTYFTTGSSTGYLKDVTVDSGQGKLNLKTEYETDLLGNVTKVTDPEGNVTTLEVNELRQTVLVTKPKPSGDTNAPQIRTYYDENDLVEKVEVRNLDEDGDAYADEWIVQRELVFNIMNRPTSSKQEVSSGVYVTTSFTYNENDLVKDTTYPEGNVVRREYDERDLPFKTTGGYGTADASTEQFDYDKNRNLWKHFGGESSTNELYTYVYNGFDQKTKRTDILDHYTKWTYETCCNLVKTEEHFNSSDTSKQKATYFYDAIKRAWKVERVAKDSDGNNIGDGIARTEYLYDKNSRLTEVKDDNANKTYHYYDAANRKTKTVDAIGETTGNYVLYTIDDNGNVTKTEKKEYNQKTSTMETLRTDYTFDALNRRTKVAVDPTGKNLISEFKFDSRGNIVWQDDPEDVVTTHTYDHRSQRLKTKYDPTGLAIEIETKWDDNGRSETRDDGNNNTTTYAYDNRDNLKTTTFADSETKTITYDDNDNLKTITDPNGSVVTNTLNNAGWVTSRSISRGTGVGGVDSEIFAYDGMGRVTSATLKESTTQISKVEYDYNTLSLVDEERQTVGALGARTIKRAYDAAGLKTGLTYPDTRALTLVNDTVNRLDQVKESTTVLADYKFRGQSTIQLDLDNDTKLEVTNDSAWRPTDWDWKRLNDQQQWVVMAGFDYAWNADSTREFEDRTHDSKGDAYRYDNLGMLTGAKYGETNLSAGTAYASYSSYDSKEEPTYDDVGNRKTVGNGTTVEYNYVNDVYTADNMNEIYDIDGTSRTHDDNGNLTDDGDTYKYDYDYQNRLIKVTNTTPNPDEVIAEYQYDHGNRRVKKVVTNSGSLNGTTLFFYDGWQVIEEQDGSGDKTAQYVYGRGIDEVLQMERDVEGDSSFETYYYHANSMGSIEMLTDDTDNDVIEEYDYDTAFGDFSTPTSLSGLDNPYHFQGRRYDSEAGLYYFRNRNYDPGSSRFIQRDPPGIWHDSVNLGNPYAFQANNQINSLDPLGLQGKLQGGEPQWSAEGALAGGGFSSTGGGGPSTWYSDYAETEWGVDPGDSDPGCPPRSDPDWLSQYFLFGLGGCPAPNVAARVCSAYFAFRERTFTEIKCRQYCWRGGKKAPGKHCNWLLTLLSSSYGCSNGPSGENMPPVGHTIYCIRTYACTCHKPVILPVPPGGERHDPSGGGEEGGGENGNDEAEPGPGQISMSGGC